MHPPWRTKSDDDNIADRPEVVVAIASTQSMMRRRANLIRAANYLEPILSGRPMIITGAIIAMSTYLLMVYSLAQVHFPTIKFSLVKVWVRPIITWILSIDIGAPSYIIN